MSESRIKAIAHDRIRAGEFACVYCGGGTTAREPDHMPPRILFKGKQRPNDLVFPSCSDCNRGSAALDTIVSWLGRSLPDGISDAEKAEVRNLGASMITNFPEVASAFFREPADKLQLSSVQKAGLARRLYGSECQRSLCSPLRRVFWRQICDGDALAADEDDRSADSTPLSAVVYQCHGDHGPRPGRDLPDIPEARAAEAGAPEYAR